MVNDMFEIKLILHSCPPFETKKKQLCSLSVTILLFFCSLVLILEDYLHDIICTNWKAI
jgi:hypothetical protein